MKNFKFFLLALIFLSHALIALGQGTPWPKLKVYVPEPDKNEGFYCNQAKKLAKDGAYRAAAMNACKCIILTDNGRRTKNSVEALFESFPLALEKSIPEAEELQKTGNEDVDQRAYALYRATLIYEELQRMMDYFQAIPADKKSCKNCPDVDFQVTSFQPKWDQARELYQSAAAKAAMHHYAKARELDQNRSRDQCKLTARACLNVLFYIEDHPEAQQLFSEVKPCATTRLYVRDIVNESDIKGIPTVDWTQSIINEAKLKITQQALDFFDLHPYGRVDNASVVLAPTIKTAFSTYSEEGPEEKICECAVTENNVEHVYKAIVKVYTQKANATIEGLYNLMDMENNQTISVTPFQVAYNAWSYEWATYSGNSKAFSCKKYKHYQSLIEKKKANRPSPEALIQEGKSRVVDSIVNGLVAYGMKIGK